jgi:hypothetical protein
MGALLKLLGIEADNSQEASELRKRLDAAEKSVGELNARLKNVEDGLSELRKFHWERHKWFATIMFGLVGVLLSGLGIWSKIDVDRAVDRAERQIKDALGTTLKKPAIHIFTTTGRLDGQQVSIPPTGYSFPTIPVFLTNDGDKSTDPVSIRLFLSDVFQLQDYWTQTASNDKEYPIEYYLAWPSGHGPSVASKETWTLATQGTFRWQAQTNVLRCKLLVYYGSEDPAQANFELRLTR